MTFDDETIRELRRTIDADKSGGGRAQQALEALGAIRDDRALLHIHAVAAHSRGKLKKRATQILGDVCRQRGLSQDELEDRIVPDLGLDEHGTMTLDFGARKFNVGFDELLRPFVRDVNGVRLAGLPHAAHADDAQKAEHAAERWKQLKSDVQTIGGEQAHRLERAMCAERHWTAAAFATHLVKHPLLGHLARRLVYGTGDKTFRIAEDGTYADADDHAIALDEKARVVIVHPAKLDEGVRSRWQQILDDYQVMQPFPQVARELIVLPPEEMSGTVTRRFEGRHVKGAAFYGLRKRGWECNYTSLFKLLDKVARALLSVEPGIFSFARAPEDQTVGDLSVIGKTFSALAPIVRAELLRDVELLCRSEAVTTS
jgi:hypothetical protein